jgi:hydrogenase/urease accessory protein HupE
MWRVVRLALCLLVFVPGWALLGAFSTLDSGFPVWWGMTVGGAFGLLMGLAFGGALPKKAADFFFGPKAARPEDEG